MSDHFLACYKCHEVVVKGSGQDLKIRSKVLLLKGGETIAVCKGCGTEIPLPLKYEEDMIKSLYVNNPTPRLYLKK